MKLKVDINCDLGEGYGIFKVGNSEKIMPYITSANIACGFHAGDPMIMMQTVKLANAHKVAIGAHPSYPDLLGFGRRDMQLTPEEIKNYTIYQISALEGFAKTVGVTLQHVKPHGAMYNMAVKDYKISKAIIEATKAFNPNLIIFAPPKSTLAKTATTARLRVAYEFFADRAYNADGSLVSRKHPNAIIHEKRKVVERTLQAIKKETVWTVDNKVLKVGKVSTVCVHGDTPTAVELTENLKRDLTKAGIEVKPVGSFI